MDPHFRDLEDHDESVRIAVKALGDMRSGASRPQGSGRHDSNSASQKPTRTKTPPITENSSSTNSPPDQTVAQRSRWQAVLLEAGGLSAAFSDDTMRRLKYCLQWLQYATAHIDAQILILRDFIASLHPLPSQALSINRRPPISEEHLRRLMDVRRDVVHTIRQVVDVVSKYAGGTLPEPAKNRIRGFVLGLPHRWASKTSLVGGTTTGERERVITGVGAAVVVAASGSGTTTRRRRAALRERGACAESGFVSSPGSRAPSPSASSSPKIARAVLSGNHAENERHVSEGSAMVAAQRILTLAMESLDMMRNVTSVVKDCLDRADAWVGRLRTAGIQRAVQDGDDVGNIPLEARSTTLVPEPEFHHHRRTISTQSSVLSLSDDAEPPTSPVLSGSSSTIWASSNPSTPGRSYSSNSFSSVFIQPSTNEIAVGPTSENEVLPAGIRLMSLSGTISRDDDEGETIDVATKEDVIGDIKVVGLDIDEDERKMDVDI